MHYSHIACWVGTSSAYLKLVVVLSREEGPNLNVCLQATATNATDSALKVVSLRK